VAENPGAQALNETIGLIVSEPLPNWQCLTLAAGVFELKEGDCLRAGRRFNAKFLADI